MAFTALNSPAILSRVRQNLRGSADPGLTTPEIPVFRRQTPVDFKKTNRPSARRSRKTSLGVAAAVSAVVFVASFESWKALTPASLAADAKTGDAPRTVTVDRPAPAATASVVLPATIRPWQTTTLVARVSGYLGAWHRDLGAQVTAGELLAEIDTPELDQQLVEGEALFREAAAAAVQAKAELVEAQADLKVAEAQLVRIQAEAELARSQLVRREKLLASRSVSQEEHETSQTQVASRTADVAAAESDIVRRRTNLETRGAIIAVREATAKSRQANVERLKELTGFKRIVAPFDGVVSRRSAEVGMLVTAGQDVLFAVEDMSRVRVQVNVPQAYARQTSAGVTAIVSMPDSSGQSVRGTVTRVADSVESSSRTMLAEIELDNASHRLQPGSYAKVALTTQSDSTAWTIPTNTVQMRVDGPHVATINDQNQIEIQRVTLGRDLGPRVVVVEGIRGDERLVVNPGDGLVDGVRVQIRSEERAAGIAER